MAPVKTAAALLAVAISPCAHGFASSRGPAATRPATPRHATETFQRSLLEAQLATGSVTASSPVADGAATAIPVDTAGAVSATPSTPAVDNAATLNAILRVAAATDRGQYATPAQKDQVSQHVAGLESHAPARAADDAGATLPSSLTGTWELLYSDTQLFRSSPFFLAGRATCTTPEQAAQYDWFCQMHRAALAISTIGVVRQVVTSEGRLINEFEVKVGAVPFLSDFVSLLKYSGGMPLTIDGAIVSTADATPVPSASGTVTQWELFMDTVEIKGSNVPFLRRILDADNVALQSRDLSRVLEDNVASYAVPKPVLRTTYVDDNTRVVRDEDDHVFLYGKVSDSEEGTDYSGVLPDLGVASLLEGFNDAVAKVYL